MKKISKGEINARLDALRNSKMDDESYDMTRPANAMCYSMSSDENEWRVSIPNISERTKGKSDNSVIKTSDYEYYLVIDFLRAIDDKNLLPDTKAKKAAFIF